MSHIVSIQTRLKDLEAINTACQRLSLPLPLHGTAQLYSSAASGLLLMLPNWQYPAVIDLATGTVSFDNFEGAWGEQRHLDCFLQMYAVERAKIEARRRGHSYCEHDLEDGSIRLQILQSS